MTCDLAIVVPVYNEIGTVSSALSRCIALREIDIQLIVVDDASTDGSWDVIEEFSKAYSNVQALRCARNSGKGSAIRLAMQAVSARNIVVHDADLEYCPSDLISMLNAKSDQKSIAVFGTRYPERRYGRRLLGQGVGVLTSATNWMYGTRLSDVMTCYKMFSSELIPLLDLQCTRFEFCTELTAKLSRIGINIIEFPISYSPRTKRQGKKIRYHHGISCVYTLYRYRNWTPACDALTR